MIFMSTIVDAVAALRELPTQDHQGLAFEKLMVNFIKADPILSGEYDEVYRWEDWKYNGGKADTGIDLVARRRLTGVLVSEKLEEPELHDHLHQCPGGHLPSRLEDLVGGLLLLPQSILQDDLQLR